MEHERPVADASWDEHYRDERDAAVLYRMLAAIEKRPSVATCSSVSPPSKTAIQPDGRNCSRSGQAAAA